ncbi:MauE/DoxX family redox-associated membrane protein [Dermacoccaceae bacterium W4C1]
MKPRTADLIGTLLRLVLGIVLIVAAGLKLENLAESRSATRAYELLPVEVANLVGTILPFAELTAGVLLVLGLLTRGSAIVAGVLMLVFIGAVSSAWARGLSIDCGCFGGGGTVAANQTAYRSEIIRDVALAACAAWLVVRPQTRWSLDGRLWGSAG